MAIFPLALPVSGKPKAADTTTSTTITTSASNEAPTTNANINGEDAADNSIDDLFGEDADNFAELFREEGPAAAYDDGDMERDDFLRNYVPPVRQGAAGQSASQPTSPARQAVSSNPDGLGLTVAASGMIPAVVAAESAPATPLPAAQFDPLDDAGWLLHIPERVVSANDTLANNAPAIGAPAKRPRGRPPGKAPPRPIVRYRCRYGCEKIATTSRGLRKHMMRVHCLFSAAHQEHLRKCDCGRTFDPNVKELICSKMTFHKLNVTDRDHINVTAPRDAQEEADTFAYDHSGPLVPDPSDPDAMKPAGPRRMVIVEDGDDEKAFREQCQNAMDLWRAGAPVDLAQFNHGLMTPGETPPPNNQAVIDLISNDEQLPATPAPTYMGNVEGRAVDYSAVNLPGNNTQLPSLPKKRAGDFEPEGEPVAKRTMRNASYNEIGAFAVAEPAPEENETFAIPEPAPEGTNVADTLDNMLATHKADFPEGDFGYVNGFDLPQQAQAQAAAFDFSDFAFADATENDTFAFNADALPSAGFGGDALGLDFSS